MIVLHFFFFFRFLGRTRLELHCQELRFGGGRYTMLRIAPSLSPRNIIHIHNYYSSRSNLLKIYPSLLVLVYRSYTIIDKLIVITTPIDCNYS